MADASDNKEEGPQSCVANGMKQASPKSDAIYRAGKAYYARKEQRLAAPHLKVKDRTISPEPADQWPALLGALGVADAELGQSLILQLCGLAKSKDGAVDEKVLNCVMALHRGLQPQDEVEALLCCQMAAVHVIAMESADQIRRVEYVQQYDMRLNALTKLTRTFAAQVEALKRHRSKGQQSVTVEHRHVHVNDGGQAIIGDVNATLALQGAGGVEKRKERAHAKRSIADAPEPALRGADAAGEPMPVTGGER